MPLKLGPFQFTDATLGPWLFQLNRFNRSEAFSTLLNGFMKAISNKYIMDLTQSSMWLMLIHFTNQTNDRLIEKAINRFINYRNDHLSNSFQITLISLCNVLHFISLIIQHKHFFPASDLRVNAAACSPLCPRRSSAQTQDWAGVDSRTGVEGPRGVGGSSSSVVALAVGRTIALAE